LTIENFKLLLERACETTLQLEIANCQFSIVNVFLPLP
jgi:hypothetical protein